VFEDDVILKTHCCILLHSFIQPLCVCVCVTNPQTRNIPL